MTSKIAIGIAILTAFTAVIGRVLLDGIKKCAISPWAGVSYSRNSEPSLYWRYIAGFAIVFVALLVELTAYAASVVRSR